MSEKTFVTGATGFVGAAVVRKLLEEGHEIAVLCRPNNDRTNIDGLEVEVVEGDLTQPETYRDALRGCKNLFHVAADYRIWVPNPVAMDKVNVEGTRGVMLAALDAGVERIVYTSSVATLGLHGDGTPSNEATPVSFADMIGVYKQSKYRAEEEVMRMIQHHGLPAIIVNPSTPVGPRDIKPTPTGKIIVNAMLGLIPAYVDTGLNVVHVDDVADGHWLALQKGKIGERYILGGDNHTLSEILLMIAKIGGHKAPTLKLPRQLLYPIATVMEFVGRHTRWEPFVTRDALRMSEKKMWFSSAKAEKELGYTHRPVERAFVEAIDWFQTNMYC